MEDMSSAMKTTTSQSEHGERGLAERTTRAAGPPEIPADVIERLLRLSRHLNED